MKETAPLSREGFSPQPFEVVWIETTPVSNARPVPRRPGARRGLHRGRNREIGLSAAGIERRVALLYYKTPTLLQDLRTRGWPDARDGMVGLSRRGHAPGRARKELP